MDYDQDTENPTELDYSWSFYSFSAKHINYADPYKFISRKTTRDNFVPLSRYRRKYETGLFYPLSYYEHGNCVWSLKGEGPQCRWDTTQLAGVAIWEHPASAIGAKDLETRREDCRASLRTYTDWCNGNCYWFSIERYDAAEDMYVNVESCGGFIGEEYLIEEIKAHLKDIPLDRVELCGHGIVALSDLSGK